ncbi:tRNA synthetases class II-domain-containing protein [Limtongia smithiae]|uniref:tRNA synthetases class II-domain-containing protein n=1 Tax=Limtongia smithiae TaxID=1125753 RepID=UPI0034CF7A77
MHWPKNMILRQSLQILWRTPLHEVLLWRSRWAEGRRRCYSTALSERLRERFAFKKATHSIAQLYLDPEISTELRLASLPVEQKVVVLHGWIDSAPRKLSKRLTFATLRGAQFDFVTSNGSSAVGLNGDSSEDLAGKNTIQLVQMHPENIKEDDYHSLRRMKQETPVCVEGTVGIHKGTDGRYEITIVKITALNDTMNFASQVRETKQWDPKDRYLQLRTPALQRALALRSRVASLVRTEFSELGFTEIETPLLFRSTPEGAREFLVPSRTNAGKMYALPQSPQQYKQLLMAGGVHRYYQIAKCFRDEDLRADRQPEFTQVDLEMAFSSAADVQAVVERVLTRVWRDVRGVHLEMPFKRLRYADAMSLYGIDKPDLRGGLELIDLSAFATSTRHSNYPVFEILKYRPSGPSDAPTLAGAPDGYPTLRSPLMYKIDLAKEPAEAWLKAAASEFKLKFHSGTSDVGAVAAVIMQAYNIQDGDILFACTRQQVPFENPTPLGRQRLHLLHGKVKSDEIAPLWVVDFPLFTPVERQEVVDGHIEFDYDSLMSTHHPFTMPVLSDESLGAVLDVASSAPDTHTQLDACTVLGQHYDIVINGVELGGGSARIHDSMLQRLILAEIMKVRGVLRDPEAEQPENPFTHLLTALSMGCPPHAGLAVGFDRLCAMLYGSESIRDVVAFPKTQSGADPLVGSPSEVRADVLLSYHMQLADKK